jgi:hypothetical protein
MKSVSRFESDLLRILWFLLKRLPAEQALPLLVARHGRPRCLSRPAVECVEDALAKGCALLLAREGWRRDRHLRRQKAVLGRLWERTPPQELGLVFSKYALQFLIWLTAENPKAGRPPWKPGQAKLEIGDLVLLYLACEAVHLTEISPMLLRQEPWVGHGLCRLAFPDEYAPLGLSEKPDFGPWTTGPGACILEALQASLAGRWLRIERGKEQIVDAARMRQLGRAQELALRGFLDAVDAAGRRDLARFLLPVASELLRERPSSQAWIGQLDARGLRLADRMEAYRSALAVPHGLDRLGEWDRQARSVGYFDEDYAAAQLWKSDWECWNGNELTAAARAIIREVEAVETVLRR